MELEIGLEQSCFIDESLIRAYGLVIPPSIISAQCSRGIIAAACERLEWIDWGFGAAIIAAAHRRLPLFPVACFGYYHVVCAQKVNGLGSLYFLESTRAIALKEPSFLVLQTNECISLIASWDHQGRTELYHKHLLEYTISLERWRMLSPVQQSVVWSPKDIYLWIGDDEPMHKIVVEGILTGRSKVMGQLTQRELARQNQDGQALQCCCREGKFSSVTCRRSTSVVDDEAIYRLKYDFVALKCAECGVILSSDCYDNMLRDAVRRHIARMKIVDNKFVSRQKAGLAKNVVIRLNLLH